MNAWAAVGLTVWLGLAAASTVLWLTRLGGIRPMSVRPAGLALFLGGEVSLTALRGGAWIGALERLAMMGTLLARWPEGIAAIVAVKAFARYPELRTGQGTGATERFIIGTFASLGWAAACTGVVMILL